MNNNIKIISNFAKNTEGWLTNKEGRFLYKCAKKCKEGVIVEIGSWKGKSTIWLAGGSLAGSKKPVYAIDPHTGSSEHWAMYGQVWTFDEFKNNIKNAGVEKIIVPIVKTSENAAKNWNKPIGLIFIDGAHEYELVKYDLKLWFPHLVDGGIMAFHDTFGLPEIAGRRILGFPGPRRVVERYLYKSKFFKNIKFVDSTTYATKVRELSLRDNIKNKIAFINRIIYNYFFGAYFVNFKVYFYYKKSKNKKCF